MADRRFHTRPKYLFHARQQAAAGLHLMYLDGMYLNMMSRVSEIHGKPANPHARLERTQVSGHEYDARVFYLFNRDRAREISEVK